MMQNKLKSLNEAIECIVSGSTIMIGGFMGCGSPKTLIDGIVNKGIQNLTIISNDTDFSGKGVGKLLSSGQMTKLIGTHIGNNPETGVKINSGELEAELVPQGTFVERIRSGGAGLGGFLTQTGLGTVVEKEKAKIVFDGKTYLLETPLKANVALIKAYKSDTWGNLIFRGSGRNFNLAMATAADYVIAEVEECVNVGEIDQEDVVLPGLFIDVVVIGGTKA